MSRTYTIKDIAQRVGVSTSTVSRVLSNAPAAEMVTEATRKRIYSAVEEFGYVPNVNARRLVQNKTHLVGVVIPAYDVSSAAHSVLLNRGFSETLGGVEDVLKQHDYRILLIFNDEKFQRQKEYLRLFKENSIDGMIIWGPRLSESYWDELRGYRAIQVNSYSSTDTALPYVGHDNVRAAGDVTAALIAKGCRRILYIGGDERISICRERRVGYEQALQEAGIAFDPELCVSQNFSPNELSAFFDRLLEEKKGKFDAVQCINDGVALCCGRMLLKRGYRIPEDIKISGGDRVEDEYGDMLDWKFPVLSFEVKCFQIGQIAARRLLEMIGGEKHIPSRKLLPVRAVGYTPASQECVCI